jgi:hypothetical protein
MGKPDTNVGELCKEIGKRQTPTGNSVRTASSAG